MSRSVEILAADWERLRRAYPELDERSLVEEVLRRGRRALEVEPEERMPDGMSLGAKLVWLRRQLPRKAAAVAVYRFRFATSRERYARAAEIEQLTYERHVDLDTEVVPPLKQEAKALRAEVRALEEELRRRGVDPGRIEPQIEWSRTMAVDEYERPGYETNESRRRTAIEFFRRVGKP